MAIERGVKAGQREPVALGGGDHGLEPVNPLIPPVAKELGVQRAHAEAAVADTVGHGDDELLGV